jgi:CelD/BcsL family acetyltransferase involved in cellulose biosynthesis
MAAVMPGAVASTTAVTVHVSEGFGELQALRAQWQRLFGARGNEPSTSFEWTAAMVRHHLRPDDRAFLIRLQRDGELVGVLPLVRRQFHIMGQPVALLMPIAEEYNTHSDVLLAANDDALADAIVSTLSGLAVQWDCFRMARLLENNPLVPLLRRALRAGRHAHSVRRGLAAYVLDLPSSYAAYLGDRSAKFRNHLKRTERKIAAAGIVKVHALSRGAAFDEAFDALLQVERASWKEGFGSSITAVERQSGFYRDFGLAAIESGSLHLQWLTLDNKPIAYNLGYLTSFGYHYLKTSYDHAYRHLGPATVLRAHLIESLIAEGIPRLDFPGEPYAWESQWAEAVRPRIVLSIYPRTIRGRLLNMIDRVRHWRSDRREVSHIDPRSGQLARVAGAIGTA